MEATNISIKQSSSVSINVETLQAIKQRLLSVINDSSFFILHSSFSRLYRHQLRLARAVARAIDRHNVISNLWIGGWTAALFLYIIIFA
jgi:hypothetical protein